MAWVSPERFEPIDMSRRFDVSLGNGYEVRGSYRYKWDRADYPNDIVLWGDFAPAADDPVQQTQYGFRLEKIIFPSVSWRTLDGLTISYEIGELSRADYRSAETLTDLLGGESNLIHGSWERDILIGNEASDHIRGLGGSDKLYGGRGADRLFGQGGNDELRGGRGHDELNGNRGDDLLKGGRGRDLLEGKNGEDILVGGRGGDTFLFANLASSRKWNGVDTILDFQPGRDLIDMSLIDADRSLDGDQSFTLIGQDEFSGDGAEIRFELRGDTTIIHADVDGDAKSDFDLRLAWQFDLTNADFVL